MDSNKTIELVEMTPEQKAEYEAFKASKNAKEVEKKKKEERDAYKALVNETIADIFPKLMLASESLKTVKSSTIKSFSNAISIKADLFKLKEEQKSHTFTNDEGNKRITVGFYTTDGYKDTVNEGIAIVVEAAKELQTDDKSRALVDTIMRFMSRDSKGNLKASKVLELEKTAIELGNDRLLEGVTIIKESYLPAISKQYIRCEYKDENNAWLNIPLGITEA